MPYTLADQHDPLITMRIHGWMTDADFERSMNDLTMLDERGRPHVIVLDCSGLRVPEIGQIRQLRAWFASSSSSTVRHRRALACVADTPMLRGTIRGSCSSAPRGSPSGCSKIPTPRIAGPRSSSRTHNRSRPDLEVDVVFE